MPQPTRFAMTAVAFEGGLGLFAVFLGWLLGNGPWETMVGRPLGEWRDALLLGLVGTVPMVLALLCMDRWPGWPFCQTKQFLQNQIVPLFADLSVGQLMLLSLAAGIGEELLFRGLVQAGVIAWIGPPNGLFAGLVLASVIFGVCHWLTTMYAILATLVGLYLGWLFLISGNLLTPIVAHALYDFVALVYLVKSRESRVKSQKGVENQEPEEP